MPCLALNRAASLLTLALCAGASGVMAAEFRSVGDHPAVLFDAPSQRANKVAVLARLQPVEIVVKLDKWSKVRDVSGELAWLENAALTDRRHVVVTTPQAEVRAQPKAGSPLAFEAQRQVILERSGAPVDGWLPVRHRDGSQGFVPVAQVWGE